MVNDGTVQLAPLYKRYFGHEATDLSQDEMYAEIVEFLYQTLETRGSAKILRERWGGPEEVFRLVWKTREPVFIMSVASDDKIAVQMYVIEQAPASSTYDEVIKVRPLPSAETWAQVQTLIYFKVTPRVLTHINGNHFETFRGPPVYYTEWPNVTTEEGTMKHRLDHAMLLMGMYVAVAKTVLPFAKRPQVEVVLAQDTASGSLYSQSQPTTPPATLSQSPLSEDELTQLLRDLNPHQRLRGSAGRLLPLRRIS